MHGWGHCGWMIQLTRKLMCCEIIGESLADCLSYGFAVGLK